MLKSAPPPSNPEVKLVVDQLLGEDQKSVSDKRSTHRVPFMRPVHVTMQHMDLQLKGFSKNVSDDGIGVLIERHLPLGSLAKLRIHTLEMPAVTFLSELRWCDEFGFGWYLSGWKFLQKVRNA